MMLIYFYLFAVMRLSNNIMRDAELMLQIENDKVDRLFCYMRLSTDKIVLSTWFDVF